MKYYYYVTEFRLKVFKRNYKRIGQDNHSVLSGLFASGTVKRPQSTILTCFDGDPLLLPHLACIVSIIFSKLIILWSVFQVLN